MKQNRRGALVVWSKLMSATPYGGKNYRIFGFVLLTTDTRACTPNIRRPSLSLPQPRLAAFVPLFPPSCHSSHAFQVLVIVMLKAPCEQRRQIRLQVVPPHLAVGHGGLLG